MIERGWLGEKSGQGFYKRVKSGAGAEILTLDPASMTYRPKQPVKLGSLDAARAIDGARERIRMLFAAKDKVGDFLRETLEPTLRYTAKVAPGIAYSADDGDGAMKWGFWWELGTCGSMAAEGSG